MIRTALLICLASALPACAGPAPETRSQLAANIGLSAQEEARLSTMQIVLLKGVMDSSVLSEDEKRRRVKAILAGASPLFLFEF